MQPFRTTRRVEFCDTDMAGIAHFSNFFRWMESAEVEFLRQRGLSVKLEVALPALSREVARRVVEQAHQVCPYSTATRNNVDVVIEVA